MSHLSVVELENELGPRLFAAEHGEAPPVMFAARYQLSRNRGHGARGLVVKARDVRLERVVALKLYPYPESADLGREVEIKAKATDPTKPDRLDGLCNNLTADPALTDVRMPREPLDKAIEKEQATVDELVEAAMGLD